MKDLPIIVNSRGQEQYPDPINEAEIERQVGAMQERGLTANEISSILVSRMRTARALGTAFEGERDYYKIFGYSREIDEQKYFNHYFRDDIVPRIINLPPNDTWGRPPILIDAGERSDQEDTASDFLKAWKVLEGRGVIGYLKRLDKLARLGRYGVLLIGVRDNKALSEPIADRLDGPRDLLYFRPKPEIQAVIQRLDTNEQSKRFGMPETYNVQFGSLDESRQSMQGMATRAVHYSRLIHAAEDLLDNEVYGVPALEKILNRIDDMMKVVGGSAEAYWKNVRYGVALVADSMASIAMNDEQKADFKAQLNEYDHDLRRILTIGGAKPHILGADPVDPKGVWEVLLAVISAATGIPQRILIGSERGELASSSDQENWSGVIEDRQLNYAEPSILRPFIAWCITYGILPPPVGGQYKVEWPSIWTPSPMQRSEIAKNLSEAIRAYMDATGVVDIVTPDEFRQHVLGLPPSETEISEPFAETEAEREAFRELETMRRNGYGQS